MDNVYQSMDEALAQDAWMQPMDDFNRAGGFAHELPEVLGSDSLFDANNFYGLQAPAAGNCHWDLHLCDQSIGGQPAVDDNIFRMHLVVQSPATDVSGSATNRIKPQVMTKGWDVQQDAVFPETAMSFLGGEMSITNIDDPTSALESEAVDAANHLSQVFGKAVINLTPRLRYRRTTCVTCQAPLDTSEQLLNIDNPTLFCTSNRKEGHPALICDHSGCGEKFGTSKELAKHSMRQLHLSFCCPIPNCWQPLPFTHGPMKSHFMMTHNDIMYGCAECGLGFRTQLDLDRHGADAMHAAYICLYPNCESMSTRIGDLIRHQLTHKSSAPRHPCPHCRTYRGNNGFKRKDHLRQHIAGYHRIEVPRVNVSYSCREINCPNNIKTWGFTTLDQLTAHMRDEHASSAFVCRQLSCMRIGMNGFATDKEFKTHMKNDHPSPFQCSQPRCSRVGNKGWRRESDMVKHMKKAHGITQLESLNISPDFGEAESESQEMVIFSQRLSSMANQYHSPFTNV